MKLNFNFDFIQNLSPIIQWVAILVIVAVIVYFFGKALLEYGGRFER